MRKKEKKMLLNRGLEPLLSPSSGMHSVLNPVEPPRLDNDLKAFITAHILSTTYVSTTITNLRQVFSGSENKGFPLTALVDQYIVDLLGRVESDQRENGFQWHFYKDELRSTEDEMEMNTTIENTEYRRRRHVCTRICGSLNTEIKFYDRAYIEMM